MTIKVKRRTETVIEAHEIWVIARSMTEVSAWCSGCAIQTVMLAPENAAKLMNIPARLIYRWVEAGRVHFMEQADEGLLICLASLPSHLAEMEVTDRSMPGPA